MFLERGKILSNKCQNLVGLANKEQMEDTGGIKDENIINYPFCGREKKMGILMIDIYPCV